jgi:MoxR-like ATPase
MRNLLEAKEAIRQLQTTLNATLLGKSQIVDLVVACLLAGGHMLFDDLPGLGKTTLAKALAVGIGGKLARVQCTPDLLPSDITGFSILNPKSREFEFRPGPVFADVLLADEINRATPRTQSALFEAMAERQVTIDGKTHPLATTFIVIATQNPVESQGAFPLPEAQLDRFAMKLRIGYPDAASELKMLANMIGVPHQPTAPSACCFQPVQLAGLLNHVATIAVEHKVQQYLVNVAVASRNHPAVALGISPRGLIMWQRISQAWAFLQGRDYVTPDDLLDVAEPVLALRLAGDFDDVQPIMHDILSRVKVPV